MGIEGMTPRTRGAAIRSRGVVCLSVFLALTLSALFAAGTAWASVASPPGPPQVSTDKLDYAPGETVTLSGANWAPGESVHLRVNDDAGQTWSRDADVTADANGNFSDSFSLPDWFVAMYTVTATGAGGAVVTATFTDGNVKYTPNRVPASGLQSVAAGTNFDFDLTLEKQGGGADPTVRLPIVVNNPSNTCGARATAIAASWLSVVSPALPTSGTGVTITTPVVYTFRASVPSGTAAGSYTGRVELTSPVGGSQTFDLCISVPADSTSPTTTASAEKATTPATTYAFGEWSNENVTVTLTAADNAGGSGVKEITYSASGVQTIAPTTVAGSSASFSISTEGTTTISFFGEDNAGNIEATQMRVIRIDKTAPTIVATAKTADDNPYTSGTWTKQDVTVHFECSDGLSGIAAGACPADLTIAADTEATGQNVSGNVSDKAGNGASSNTINVKVDKSAPAVTVALERAPDHGGWYNAPVGYGITTSADDLSGIASCQTDATYSGPDGEPVSVSRSCTDNVGNVGTGSASFGFDDTDPLVTVELRRAPDHNDWYNADVDYGVETSSDNLSGIDSCQPDETYSGPDSASASVTRTCADAAGNVGAGSADFQFDNNAPFDVATALLRAPDHGGWYNHAVDWETTGDDATSGIDSCSSGTYSGPDGVDNAVSGLCTDNAGNDSAAADSAPFDYDATAPAIVRNFAADSCPAGGNNGWCRGTQTAGFTATDATSGLPDAESGSVGSRSFTQSSPVEGASVMIASGPVADLAGNTNPGIEAGPFKIDQTAPTVSVSATQGTGSSSSPYAENEWTNLQVAVDFACVDQPGLSGVAAGDPTGDEMFTAEGVHTATGHCSDAAGNAAAPKTFGVRIDQTAPTISGSASPAANANGWNKTNVLVSFTCADALSGIQSCGPDETLSDNAAGQSATGTAEDKAGNAADATVSGINIDKLAPTVTVTGVENGATYPLGAVPAAGCSTADQAELSGVDSPATVAVAGGTGLGVGAFTATCSGATDDAGNLAAPVTATYYVNYRWDGFLQPINDTAHQVGLQLSVFKAGSTVPAKFQLKQADGTIVQATSLPQWLAPVKLNSMSATVDEGVYTDSPTAGSYYRWDSTAQQYIYNWSTKGLQAGYWYKIFAKFDDGSTKYVIIGLR
jgi:hypothetical protein